jgi:O-antigen/teichoic acid export membrane protein
MKVATGLLSNASLLLGASILYQVVSLAGLFVIARVYSPDQLGGLTTVVALGALAASLAGGRFDLAIVTEPEMDESGRLLCLSALLAAVGGALAAVGCAVFALIGDSSRASPAFLQALWFLPLLTVTMGLTPVGVACATRARRYELIAGTQLASVVLATGAQILLPDILSKDISLPVGLVIGQTVGLLVLSPAVHTLYPSFASVKARDLLHTAWRARTYPMHAAPYSFLIQLYAQLPQLLIGAFYGLGMAGQYSNAVRLTAAPINVLPTSMAPVVFGEIARTPADRRWGHQVALLSAICGVLASPFVAAVLSCGPTAFRLVLGPDWLQAGAFAQQVVFASLLIALVRGYDRIFDVYGLQRLRLGLSMAYTVIVAAVLGGTALAGIEIEHFVLLSVLLQIVFAANWSYWAFLKAGFSIKPLLLALSAAILSILVFWYLFSLIDLQALLIRGAGLLRTEKL